MRVPEFAWDDANEAHIDEHRVTLGGAEEVEMTAEANRRRTVILSLDEIPPEMCEDEEHRFWSSHTLSEALVAQAEPLPEEAVVLLDQIRARRERHRAAAHLPR